MIHHKYVSHNVVVAPAKAMVEFGKKNNRPMTTPEIQERLQRKNNKRQLAPHHKNSHGLTEDDGAATKNNDGVVGCGERGKVSWSPRLLDKMKFKTCPREKISESHTKQAKISRYTTDSKSIFICSTPRGP
jgi:hypothetical protein